MIRNKILVICLGCIGLLSSCKKEYLDLQPYDQVALESALLSQGDILAATNGLYTVMRGSATYGKDIILKADMMADNAYVSASNSNRFVEYFQLNYILTTPSVAGTWNASYNIILRANNIINSTIAANATINQYKGEALTIRAMVYHDLVKQFGKQYNASTSSTDLGVPIILNYDPTLKPARSTVKEVYDQIEKDLLAAIPLLTERAPYSARFVNVNAAKLLLARVYQFKAEWQKARTLALEVINSGGYSLTNSTNHATYWAQTASRTDKVESIFEISHDANGNGGNEALPYLFLQAGYGDILATDEFYNSLSSTDVRRSLLLNVVRAGRNVYAVNKYTSPINFAIKLLRLSEAYFIAAEASYHLSNPTDALSYLNAVATRRDPNFIGYVSVGTQILDDILTERRKELAFEGHRYWDFVRYNKDVVRVNVNSNYPSNVPLTFPASSFRRILPIPQGEMDANPNIRTQQNSGY